MIPVHEPLEDGILRAMGVLNLAHVGDGVYELLARTHVARQGAVRLNDQHRATIALVSAPAQAAAAERLTPVLTEEELRLFKRGRNTRVHGCPPGCTAAQYHAATALEALFGWLWLSGRAARAAELFDLIVSEGGESAS